MNERELIKHLSALKHISADPTWVKKNRDVLSYQIFNGAEYTPSTLGFFERFSLISKRVLQPTPIAALIALFFLVSGAAGFRASRNATPGEFGYIAKEISEKAQYTLAFNETDKARLNLQFASQRATEIQQVLNESNDNTSDPRVQELAANFRKEIDAARGRIESIETTKAKQATATAATKQKLTAKTNLKSDTNQDGVVSAGSGKNTKGIDISSPSAQKDLEEAEKLFDKKDYSGAATKLNQIGQSLH